jgi:hypothetical protein
MTPEQQRIAIAEFCGWKDCHLSESWASIIGTLYEVNGNQYAMIPNYFSDLNAMHEAWQLLTHEQKLAYRREIALIASREVPNRQSHWLEDIAAEFGHEAYLRTIGKWIE